MKKEEISEEDLEEILEDEEETDEENLAEDFEEILFASQERNSRIKHILANPWKNVSLLETRKTPSQELENLIPEKKKEKKSKEEELIDYRPKKPEEGNYISSLNFVKTERKDLSQDVKNIHEQKRMYEKIKTKEDEKREYITFSEMKQEYKILKEDIR